MTGFFGAWLWIFIAALTLAALAVGAPLAVVATLAGIERGGSWTADQIRRLVRGQAARPNTRGTDDAEEGGRGTRKRHDALTRAASRS